MCHHECSTFANALANVPDPRQRRGIRHEWSVILLLVSLGLLNQHQTLEGISDWVQEHADQLQETLHLARVPSRSTLRRAMERLDISRLEAQIHQVGTHVLDMLPQTVRALALDGKAVRGAQMQGQKVHLLSLVTHEHGLVLEQRAVGEKTNEIPVAQQMLAQRSLAGWLVTADALHTQRATVDTIVRQGGHYLLVVKENQPELAAALADWFAEPAWADEQEVQVSTEESGHGRLERRSLTCRVLTTGLPTWPSVRQVSRRVTWRRRYRTGHTEERVTYAITNLSRDQASATDLAAYWRGHWTIENRVHYVRDVTWGEDASQCANGATAQALAALRNGLLTLLRAFPIRRSIPATLRFFAASLPRALAFLRTCLC